MKKLSPLLVIFAALTVSNFSFAATPKPTLASIVEKLGNECAGNGSPSTLDTYDTKTFDAAKEMSRLVGWRVKSCKRTYSKSKADGIQLTVNYLQDKAWCAGQTLTPAEMSVLKKVLRDRSNRAVLASITNDDENPEGCSFWYFRIYRQSGELIDLQFDETD